MTDRTLLRPRELPGDPIDPDRLVDAYRQACRADPVHQARVVWWALRHDPHLEASTADRMGAVIARFAARQRALGCDRLSATTPEHAVGFVWARTARNADPAIATVHLRRTALRMLVRALAQLNDPPSVDPTATLVLPSKTRAQLRPLDTDEVGLLRIAAAGRARYRLEAMALLALAETTATTGEIAALGWPQLDLAEGSVALPGAGAIHPRTGKLTGWGVAALNRWNERHAEPGPGLPIVYQGRARPGSQASQATIVSRLSRLLARAGLTGDDIRPTSIRLWQPARQLSEGARIETVARLLGHTSLDATAAQLGYRWQRP